MRNRIKHGKAGKRRAEWAQIRWYVIFCQILFQSGCCERIWCYPGEDPCFFLLQTIRNRNTPLLWQWRLWRAVGAFLPTAGSAPTTQALYTQLSSLPSAWFPFLSNRRSLWRIEGELTLPPSSLLRPSIPKSPQGTCSAMRLGLNIIHACTSMVLKYD